MTVVAVVGLGYVGLPLVVEFGKLGRTIGFDIVTEKVAKCRAGTDPSREIPDADMQAARHAEYTSDAADLRHADVVIVAVPTRTTDLNCGFTRENRTVDASLVTLTPAYTDNTVQSAASIQFK